MCSVFIHTYRQTFLGPVENPCHAAAGPGIATVVTDSIVNQATAFFALFDFDE
jgi:hypothetical protein